MQPPPHTHTHIAYFKLRHQFAFDNKFSYMLEVVFKYLMKKNAASIIYFIMHITTLSKKKTYIIQIDNSGHYELTQRQTQWTRRGFMRSRTQVFQASMFLEIDISRACNSIPFQQEWL